MKGAGGQNSGDSPISVFVRIRPPACSGRSADETQVVRSSSKSQVCVQSSNQTQKTFTYDRVFGPEANQEQIFVNTTKPVLDEVLNGYSCTIFAYGQTGTGKTYTMSGDFSSPEKSGIIPRSIKQLFNRLQDENIVEFVVK
ncbi:MAG: Kinesin-related motor protein [Paramarteilia canceri]